MSCWTVLGLSADADTRTIKRQYAALLKQTRPDEDPEGFQRLREAYEHALNAKEWEHFSEQDPREEASWDLTDLSGTQIDVLQQVTRSLNGVSLGELQQRHALALQHGALDVMEDEVLRHCVEHPDTSKALLEWAIETFYWFSAWQRLELDEEQIEQLLAQQRQGITHYLREALEREDAEVFLQIYAQCFSHQWLKGEHHRQWFNELLSQLLLDSRFWSSTIFEAVSTGQGWHAGPASPCPKAEWQRLVDRHEAPIFLATQKNLATQPTATPEHRAAHLLLAPGSFSQRRAFARRLREEDWAQCRKLSSALYANLPEICEAMPGGTPFFWREWEHTVDSWPIYLGIVLACLIGSFVLYAPDGERLGSLIGVAVFWSVIFSAGGWVLHWLMHQLAHRVWLLDDRLSAYLLPGFNPPPFGVLRDLLPCTVMAAGIGKVYGLIGSGVYVATLVGVGLMRRYDGTLRVSWQPSSPWIKRSLAGAGILLLVTLLGVFKVISSQGTVNRNQGLQPWTERLCSRMPASASECAAPATMEQWYGKEAER
jgi:hypothetical protein